MEELLGVFLGFVLAAAASVVLARHQQRHETRVRILREILPKVDYPVHSLPAEAFATVDDLVSAAIVLQRDEREIASRIYTVFEERKGIGAFPGAVYEALTPDATALVDTHRDLIKRLDEARADLKHLIGKRLRWVGRLTDTEKKALGVSTD